MTVPCVSADCVSLDHQGMSVCPSVRLSRCQAPPPYTLTLALQRARRAGSAPWWRLVRTSSRYSAPLRRSVHESRVGRNQLRVECRLQRQLCTNHSARHITLSTNHTTRRTAQHKLTFHRNTSSDCNTGLVFPIPGFGIADFVIPGSCWDNRISSKMGFTTITWSV